MKDWVMYLPAVELHAFRSDVKAAREAGVYEDLRDVLAFWSCAAACWNPMPLTSGEMM